MLSSIIVLKPHWNLDSILSKNSKSCLLSNLSKIFEKTGRMLTGLQLFFNVRAPFLKSGLIFANFRQLENLPFSNDLLKWKQIASAKKSSFTLTILSRMSLFWMAFWDTQHFYFCKNVSLKTKLKEKFALFYILVLLIGYLDGFSI